MLVFKKFEPKGSKFNDELEQQKLVAVKIHTLSNVDAQCDDFLWEEHTKIQQKQIFAIFGGKKPEDEWDKPGHKYYLELAKEVLKEVDFVSAVSMLDFAEELGCCRLKV